MRKGVHRFVYLSRSDRRLVLEAALLLGAARLGLWLLPFRVVSRLFETVTRTRVAVAAPAQRVAWAIGAAARYIPAATCLTQALAARAMLARHGHTAQLRIGVARAIPQPGALRISGNQHSQFAILQAHAWVECDGAVIVGGLPDLARYTALPSHEAIH
jgi:hypothetical protein